MSDKNKRSTFRCVLFVLCFLQSVQLRDCIKIDSHLIPVSSECYERVAIGQRFPTKEVSRSIFSQSITTCEKECRRDDRCLAFSYGISSQGNGTCELSAKRPTVIQEDEEYDLYVMKDECLRSGPEPDNPTPHQGNRVIACFRQLYVGRRVAEPHVRRSLPAHSVDECEDECDKEKHFTCEGFNIRVDHDGFGRGTCELIAVPTSVLDFYRDYVPDRDYDFYERDRNGPPDCRRLLTGPPDGGPYKGSDPYGPWGSGVPSRPPYGSGGSWDNYPGSWSYRGPGGSWYDRPHGNDYSPYDRDQSQVGFYGGNRERRPYERPWGGSGWYDKPPPSGGSSWNRDRDRDRDRDRGHATSYGFPEECFIRARVGFKTDRKTIRNALAVPSLYDCEYACATEKHFPCKIFSFRYTSNPSFPPENCYLGDRDYQDLNPYNDLLPDRDYDIYGKNDYERTCADPWPTSRPWAGDSECFQRVRTGQRLDSSIVRDSISALSIGDCEAECLKSKYFTCRIFSFRYGSPVIGGPLDNCQLSDWPSSELDYRRHLVEDIGYELYERGSYGLGCEIDHHRPPQGPQVIGVRPVVPARPTPKDQLCYVGYSGPARLLPSAVQSSLSVETELDCKAECTRAREEFIFRCMSLSFRSSPPSARSAEHRMKREELLSLHHNCFLSEIEQRDLRPGVDYLHDEDYWLFAWNSRDLRCRIEEIPYQNQQHHGDHNTGPPVRYPPDRDDGSTWKWFSVSGKPCRRNSPCSVNRIAGFWSCELEGAEESAWDYCCRPGHHCGYSEGFSYPWCYVGEASPDQWRPCSDRYYPYSPPQRRPTDPYGPPRYWPVSYLHHDRPPNATDYHQISFPDRRPTYYDDYGGHIDNSIDNNGWRYGKKIDDWRRGWRPLNKTAPEQKNDTCNTNSTEENKNSDLKVKPNDDTLFEIVDIIGTKPNDTDEKWVPLLPVESVKPQPRFAKKEDEFFTTRRDTRGRGFGWDNTGAYPLQFKRRDDVKVVSSGLIAVRPAIDSNS